MNYSDELDNSIHIGLNELIERYDNHDHIFNVENNLDYYQKYKNKELQKE